MVKMRRSKNNVEDYGETEETTKDDAANTVGDATVEDHEKKKLRTPWMKFKQFIPKRPQYMHVLHVFAMCSVIGIYCCAFNVIECTYWNVLEFGFMYFNLIHCKAA